MKKLFILLVSYLLSTTNSFSNDVPKDKIEATPTVSFSWAGEIGIPDRACKGIGLGCLDLIIIITIRQAVANPNEIVANASMLNSTTMSFTFKPDAGETDKELLVETASKNLFQPLSKTFGYSSIELVPGAYSVTRQRDGRLTATLKVITK